MQARKVLFSFVFLVFGLGVMGQDMVQVVRGTITDKNSNQPLIGAVVIVVGSNPALGAVSDAYGKFRIDRVPVGKPTLQFSYTGYKPYVVTPVVNSGKELVMTIVLEEDIAQLNAIEIAAERDKRNPLNAMSTVSSRTFSVEETQKFAAAVNDPGRMAQSYAGVISTDDGNNKISIRGNSPYGLLWRMEGVDIPNPNHFASPASSGGGISILSSQTLANSDFVTGAFSAEYGNALAGVFDLRLRKGNNEKREYTLQAGFLGLDIAAEGPFKKGYAGSYLINYRYSTLSLLGRMGVNVGTGITNFQDVSFNFYMPTKKFGQFQLFGFAGLSSQFEDAKRDTTAWDYYWQRYDRKFYSNTAAVGVKQLININDKGYLTNTILFSGNNQGYWQDRLSDEFATRRDYEEKNSTTRITISSVYNYKLNAQHTLRFGGYWNTYGFSLLKKYLNYDTDQTEIQLDARGSRETVQAFGQWKYRMTEQFTLNLGAHLLAMPVSNSISIEPRAGAKYQLNETNAISLGYGLHSQMQPIGVYMAQSIQGDGTYSHPNEKLGFNKAHHLVIGYQKSLTKYLYLKSEIYYQHLFNIAVGAERSSTLSTLNNDDNYITTPLINAGRGKNYGVELTLEQFTHNNMYFLLSTSLYNSQYQALDGVWRNTRFNGNFATSFTGGKEFNVGSEEKHRILGVNLRVLYTGGLRSTPIDFNASVTKGETQYIDSRAYELQNSNYFRSDLRISLKRNHKHSTTTLALDIQNFTNHKNIGGSFFDPQSGLVQTYYQVPLIPILSYRVEF